MMIIAIYARKNTPRLLLQCEFHLINATHESRKKNAKTLESNLRIKKRRYGRREFLNIFHPCESTSLKLCGHTTVNNMKHSGVQATQPQQPEGAISIS